MIKQMAPLSVKPLYIIFLQSIGQSQFPTQWKCARVTPLYKGKGTRSDTNNIKVRALVMTQIIIICVTTSALTFIQGCNTCTFPLSWKLTLSN